MQIQNNFFKHKKLKTIDDFFKDQPKKIQLAYQIKCCYLDYLYDFPKDCWIPISEVEIKNQAAGQILHMLDKSRLSIFFRKIFNEKEQIFLMDHMRQQALDFVEENWDEIHQKINKDL